MGYTNDTKTIGIALLASILLVGVASLIVKKDDIESMLEKPISVRKRKYAGNSESGS